MDDTKWDVQGWLDREVEYYQRTYAMRDPRRFVLNMLVEGGYTAEHDEVNPLSAAEIEIAKTHICKSLAIGR